jgi:predicted Zn finger-like uncharacterized protein
MSLITSCPACGTMFRVVPDQLKISEGWVRCGHCTEVFDATANLADEDALPSQFAAPAEPPEPPEPPPGAVRPAGEAPPPPMPPATTSVPLPQRAAADVVVVAPPARSPASRSRLTDSELEPSDLDAPFVFRRSDLIEPDPVPSVMPALAPGSDSRLEDDADDAATLGRVSFVRQARRKAFWRRPLVRAGLVLASLALAALLVLQLAHHDRDRLALAQPQLRPALERMCALLQCTLAPPRQIEAVVIESSGFNRLRNDTYKLTFAVRNNAPVAVAAPSMELTLTDTRDQPVLRRVLTPAELGARDGSIGAGADWSGSLGLVLDAGGERVAGYRLLAFYP